MKFLFHNIPLLLLCILTNMQVYAQSGSQSKTISLFAQSKSTSQALEKAEDELWREPVSINRNILNEDFVDTDMIIDVDLIIGETIQAKVQSVETNVTGTTAISAQIDGEVPGNLILTYKNDRLFGTLNLYDQHRIFHIKSDPKMDDSYVSELDHSMLEPFECEVVLGDEENRHERKFGATNRR